MILDIDYSKYHHKLTISYVNERGNKSFLEMNTNRFKSYMFDKDGDFENWDGRKCTQIFTDKPSKFDIRTYINEISEDKQKLINQKVFPNLYSFDIEIEYDPAEKPDPSSAKFPITTISICSPNMTTLVLGVKDIGSEENINKRYSDYLKDIKFFNDSNHEAKFVYKKFNNEGDMLLYFLKNIVAKCTVLAGWNIWGFDWQYIYNRIEKFYPEISIRNSSPVFRTKNKNVHGFFNNKEVVKVQIPQHVMLVDMMDVIAEHDRVVIPMKESMSLDWISKESIGSQKVQYDGSLADLYNDDFDTYVLYNAIDSALVQLIDQYFKTMQLIYVYSNITKLPIDQCLGKIAVAEALFFEEFYRDNKKVVWDKKQDIERGTLQGAYVKLPIPGRYNYAMCFDFAGLYPSQVITCNLSVENFIHPPEDGWSEEQLESFKQDPLYFVSVNNHVYKNDRDYAFRRIQIMLKEERNKTKYLAKDLDAQVIPLIEDIISKKKLHKLKWKDNVVQYMMDTYDISSIKELEEVEDIKDLYRKLKGDITYMIMADMAFKLVGNSCYGGSAHIAFFWFNIAMANDVTGESRNLFRMMDELANDVLGSKFIENKEIHELLGVEIDEKKYTNELQRVKDIVVYGDTDSNYLVINHILNSIKGVENWNDLEKTQFCVDLSEKYLNNLFNTTLFNFFDKRHGKSVHNFELETVAKTGIWIDKKKRYGQSILWKDGRMYDTPQIKIKGLEIVRSSSPKYSRKILKDMMGVLLLDDDSDFKLVNKLNNISQKALHTAPNQYIDDLCENMSVNNYAKYVINDRDGRYPETIKGTPFNVNATALYNWTVNTNKYQDDNIYGGKIKIYVIDDNKRRTKSKGDNYFAYVAESYPKWGDNTYPINYAVMHDKTILKPINRILEAIGMNTLRTDGSLSMTLF